MPSFYPDVQIKLVKHMMAVKSAIEGCRQGSLQTRGRSSAAGVVTENSDGKGGEGDDVRSTILDPVCRRLITLWKITKCGARSLEQTCRRKKKKKAVPWALISHMSTRDSTTPTEKNQDREGPCVAGDCLVFTWQVWISHFGLFVHCGEANNGDGFADDQSRAYCNFISLPSEILPCRTRKASREQRLPCLAQPSGP